MNRQLGATAPSTERLPGAQVPRAFSVHPVRDAAVPARSRAQGAAVVALLIGAIVFCGLLAYLLAGGSSPARAMRLRGTSAELVAQAQYIRQQIARCAAEWPGGNNATGFHPAYPAATIAVSVTALTCPGSSQNVWAGTDGALAPTPPTGMGAWMYLNTATAQISIKTSNATEWGSALTSAAAAIGSSEASTSGSPVDTLTVKIVQ